MGEKIIHIGILGAADGLFVKSGGLKETLGILTPGMGRIEHERNPLVGRAKDIEGWQAIEVGFEGCFRRGLVVVRQMMVSVCHPAQAVAYRAKESTLSPQWCHQNLRRTNSPYHSVEFEL